MKKLLCLILCAVMLFAFVACNDDEPELQNDTPSDKTPPSEENQPAPPELSDFERRLAALDAFEMRKPDIMERRHPYTTYELIPGDYGVLYPFPAFNADDGYGYGILYGFMTADGQVVVDGIFEFMWFVDINDGYYRTHRFIPSLNDNEYGDWETRYIAIDGSRELILPERSYYFAMLDDETVRVFQHNGFDAENWWDLMQVGIIDMDGNIVSPFVNVNENYKRFFFGGGQFESALHVNIHTGEHFIHFYGAHWLSYEGGNFIVENAKINAQGEIEAMFIHTPDINETDWFIKDGITVKFGDYIIRRDENAEDEVVGEGEEWEYIRPHRSVVLTDKDGNALMTFPDGIGFRGDLFVCADSGNTYDFDLNEISFGEFRSVARHLNDDVYVFANAASYHATRYLLVNISSGRQIELGDIWFIYAVPGNPGQFIGKDTLFDLNSETTELIFPEGNYYFDTENRNTDDLIVILSMDSGLRGLFTFSGEELLPFAYNSLLHIGDGLLEAYIDNYIGVINRHGEWIVRFDTLGTKPD
ncbi:MAG: WG repeat-containing protein [Oscillospiraceae bacterium]|jgi:hypothetical protein|nr:WG repeat-containing protein [Oscillospiraceae bacterium]